jgi:hypothetical protein
MTRIERVVYRLLLLAMPGLRKRLRKLEDRIGVNEKECIDNRNWLEELQEQVDQEL